MELPSTHRIPLAWLLEHGSEAIRYRTLTELSPTGSVTPEAIAAAQQAVVELEVQCRADQEAEGHRDLGREPPWPGALGEGRDQGESAPSRSTGASCRSGGPADRAHSSSPTGCSSGCSPGTKIRRCSSSLPRPRLDRTGGGTVHSRGVPGAAAAAALAEAGHHEDPRLRGAAHKIANAVSAFLRSPLAEKPFVKTAKHTALNPEAHPPTWYSVAMIAQMPSLQRERAGFTERLGHYLAQPAPKKDFVVVLGKKALKPQHLLLGDPIEADSKGVAKDLPLALHYIEMLARMGALQWAPVATKVLARLLKDFDEQGVWAPKGLARHAEGAEQDHVSLVPAPDRRKGSRQPRCGRDVPGGGHRQAAQLGALVTTEADVSS